MKGMTDSCVPASSCRICRKTCVLPCQNLRFALPYATFLMYVLYVYMILIEAYPCNILTYILNVCVKSMKA